MKQLDQCEMILQASEYEDLENKPGRLQDFYDSTAGTQCYCQQACILIRLTLSLENNVIFVKSSVVNVF